jgi:hypothetical protein
MERHGGFFIRPMPYLLIVCSLLAAGAIAFGLKCRVAIHSPYELDYGEGPVLWQAQNIIHLSKAFHRIQQYPHCRSITCRSTISQPGVRRCSPTTCSLPDGGSLSFPRY